MKANGLALLLSITLALLGGYSCADSTGRPLPVDVAWAVAAGGRGVDDGFRLYALPDGSAFVAGYFRETSVFGEGGVNAKTLYSAGEADGYIARYNAGGSLAWVTTVGGSENEIVLNLTALPDGSSLITGTFHGTTLVGDPTRNAIELTVAGGQGWDVFLARLDPFGEPVWAVREGGVLGESSVSVDALADGTSFIAGEFSGSAVFGAGGPNETALTSTTPGTQDGYACKYSPEGRLMCAIHVSRSELIDQCHSVSAFPDGSFLVTGFFQGSSTFGLGEPNETTLISNGEADIFVARYNQDCTLEWVFNVGGTIDDTPDRVVAMSDGSFFLAGEFYAQITLGAGEPNETVLVSKGKSDIFPDGFSDIFLARYNADRTLAWAVRAGSDSEYWETIGSISALPDGRCFMAGTFGDYATFGPGEINQTDLTSYGCWDAFIAAFNQDGTLAWATNAGSPCESYFWDLDHGNGITALPDGTIFVSGSFSGTAKFVRGSRTQRRLDSRGLTDMFLVKLVELE